MALALPALPADWVRAGEGADKPLWGIKDGLHFGIYPASVRGGKSEGGPRGLIRIGYPTLPGEHYDLITFIAVEPSVKGRGKGFSELEHSQLDNAQGKRIWASAADEVKPAETPDAGRVRTLGAGVEQLDVTLRVEKFSNGAHVYLVASQRSDAPDEVAFSVHTEPGSAPLESCVLTATFGNLMRGRQLWLKDGAVSSLKTYPNYKGSAFAPDKTYPLSRLHHTAQGDVIVALTNDEADPASVRPVPDSGKWHYGGFKVTQYWKQHKGKFPEDVHARVNGRYMYWASHQVIPGGIAFENFELREHFHNGQQFIFGVTRKTPKELGF